MADFSPTGLRVLREIAQRGSFSAAARGLGYTQSAVSRQVAALETIAGRPLFERGRTGAVLTPAGGRLLARAVRVLDELDAAAREVVAPDVSGPVRLGAFASAAAGLTPRVLVAVPPGVVVTVREATTPALTRALRAGTLDLAVLASQPPFRPPDAESPPLALATLSEDELLVAVGPTHPFAGRRAVLVEELADQVWVSSRSASGDGLLGVWPGLAGRADVRYVVQDWLAKLTLVAAGTAITTLPPLLVGALPAGVTAVAVRGGPRETRRLLLARPPGPMPAAVAVVAEAVRSVVPTDRWPADAVAEARGG